jgi:hypothetical protein
MSQHHLTPCTHKPIPNQNFPFPIIVLKQKTKKIKNFRWKSPLRDTSLDLISRPRDEAEATNQRMQASLARIVKPCEEKLSRRKSQPLTDEMRVTLLEAKSLSAGWRERTLALASIDPSQAHRDLCCVLWEMECSFWEDDGWHQITI